MPDIKISSGLLNNLPLIKEASKKNVPIILSTGMAYLNEISDAILRLNKESNYTFFVIEHDMDLIEKICDPVIVMAEGSVLFEGKFDEVKSNEEVIEAYLGRGLKSKK